MPKSRARQECPQCRPLKKQTHMTSTSHIKIYIRKKVPKVGRLFFRLHESVKHLLHRDLADLYSLIV